MRSMERGGGGESHTRAIGAETRTLWYLWLGLGLWGWCPAMALEPIHWRWQPGQQFERFFEISGHQIPLPGKGWTLAGIGVDPVKLALRQPYGVIFSLVLFKHSGSVVDAFLILHANAISTGDNWGLSADCLRKEIPFTSIEDNTERHAFCSFVRPLAIAPRQPLIAWQKAVDFAKQAGWTLAPTWWEVGFRMSDPFDVVDIRYAFRTETASVRASAPAAAPVQDHQNNLATTLTTALTHVWHSVDGWSNAPHTTHPSNPIPATTADNLAQWARDTSPVIKLGFKHRLTDAFVHRMPNEPRPRAETVVTQAPTQENPAPKEMSNATLGLLKTLSSRVTNITTSLGIDYLFVRDIYTVSGLQVVSSTLHGGVDYLEELMWNTYGPQRLRQAGTVDFTYLNAP